MLWPPALIALALGSSAYISLGKNIPQVVLATFSVIVVAAAGFIAPNLNLTTGWLLGIRCAREAANRRQPHRALRPAHSYRHNVPGFHTELVFLHNGPAGPHPRPGHLVTRTGQLLLCPGNHHRASGPFHQDRCPSWFKGRSDLVVDNRPGGSLHPPPTGSTGPFDRNNRWDPDC